MNISQLKNALIPELNTFCGVPIIEADQTGDKPDGSHATFKVTSPYIKGVGQAEEKGEPTSTSYQLVRTEDYQTTISFTTYAKDADASLDLANKIYDWFDFAGYFFLDENKIVVIDKTPVDNRDSFLIDEYERRNGFDVTLRLSRQLTKDIEYIEDVKGITTD